MNKGSGRVLVANRGEIAVRIVRACREEGLEAVVTVSDADEGSLAARLADHVVHIGPSSPAQSYLRVEQVVAAAVLTDCDAVHPGYGFLSERPELAEACEVHGLVFVGPDPRAIRVGGDKIEARRLAASIGVPVGAGSANLASVDEAAAAADEAGYPVLLKAAAGGGGRGMGRVDDRHDLLERYAVAAAEADVAFGDGRLYVERLVEHARHVEVQILADAHGNVVHLGDRDCSVQRRYQKMIEEAPASALSERMRDQLADAAIAVAQRLDYRNAGTVEFLIDLDRDEFSFLEVNTRVQVEHPVTEMVSGIDIVREQLRIAAGERLSFAQSDVNLIGHAIECRINAESPRHEFTPSPGVIETWRIPGHSYVRVDTHVDDGYEIPPFYDSLIAKLIVCGANRSQAIDRLQDALGDFVVEGVDTTIGLHQRIVEDGDFRDDAITTGWLEEVLLPRLARETSVP